MVTDTSEQGLERLICIALAGHPCEPNTGTAEQSTIGHAESGWEACLCRRETRRLLDGYLMEGGI